MDVRYITDENGKRVGVIQDIKEYERLLEAFKELEDIRAYDEAMEDLAAGEKSIPLEKVVAEIERERQSG